MRPIILRNPPYLTDRLGNCTALRNELFSICLAVRRVRSLEQSTSI